MPRLKAKKESCICFSARPRRSVAMNSSGLSKAANRSAMDLFMAQADRVRAEDDFGELVVAAAKWLERAGETFQPSDAARFLAVGLELIEKAQVVQVRGNDEWRAVASLGPKQRVAVTAAVRIKEDAP